MNPPETPSTPSESATDSAQGSSASRFVALLGFPSSLGRSLETKLRDEAGIHCRRFSRAAFAERYPQEDYPLICLWIDEGVAFYPESNGPRAIALGDALSPAKHAELTAEGFAASYSVADFSDRELSRLVAAHASRPLPRSSGPPALMSPDANPRRNAESGTQFLAWAVQQLDLGVYVIEQNGEMTLSVWNDEMENLFQQRRSSVIGKPLHSVFTDPLLRNVLSEMGSARTRNRAIIPSKSESRSHFIADISKSCLYDQEGKIVSIVGIIQDVTNRIHSENRLIAAFNELESSKEKLEQSNIEIRKGIEKAKKLAVVAQSSNKAKSYFLSNISHELRTPLNSIVSLTHALLEGTFGNLNPKQREHLDIVSDSSKHLQSLINDILDLSKIELGKMTLKFAAANLEELARSSIRMIEQEASYKNVSCILKINTDQDAIDADGKRLRQILLNLLVNAVKFTKPDTDVVLSIDDGPCADTVSFRVADQGIGISQSDFAKIFSPFTQLDDSLSRQYEGTGLGLAIASKFVELHGGGLHLSSEPGIGSAFEIVLPVSPAPRPPQSASLAELAASPQNARALVIVVDENERAAARLMSQIGQTSHLLPVSAMPNEISAYHDQIAPRAIFVDLSIISAHGADWIQNAKRHPAWKRAKWIAVGSIDLPDNAELATRFGFDHWACKPLPPTLAASLLP